MKSEESVSLLVYLLFDSFLFPLSFFLFPLSSFLFLLPLPSSLFSPFVPLGLRSSQLGCVAFAFVSLFILHSPLLCLSSADRLVYNIYRFRRRPADIRAAHSLLSVGFLQNQFKCALRSGLPSSWCPPGSCPRT